MGRGGCAGAEEGIQNTEGAKRKSPTATSDENGQNAAGLSLNQTAPVGNDFGAKWSNVKRKQQKEGKETFIREQKKMESQILVIGEYEKEPARSEKLAGCTTACGASIEERPASAVAPLRIKRRPLQRRASGGILEGRSHAPAPVVRSWRTMRA